MKKDKTETKDKFWKGKKVLITGGAGFLGSHLTPRIKKLGARVLVPMFGKYDLRNYDDCLKVCKKMDIVIHLAANVGGIGYNLANPADLFDDNILMGVNIMRAAKKQGVKKLLALGTICAYPKYTPVPFKEENLWYGYPEETNAPYGLAKKMLLVQGQAYKKQFGFNFIYLLPVNLYGPGDKFDPKVSHVIPALIRKFVLAKKNGEKKVVVWGTGKPTREFLYVEDAAEGIIKAVEKYNKDEPVNLGAGFEISIKDLAQKIKKIVGYKGTLIWDKTKPNGQPRRKLDTSRAKKEFGFQAHTDFDTGLKETIAWYEKTLTSA